MHKIDHFKTKEFFGMHSVHPLKSSSTARAQNMPAKYESVMRQISESIGEDNIWVSIDETTDKVGRTIAVFIVGRINNEQIGPFMLNEEELPGKTAEDLETFFIKSLKLLYPSIEGLQLNLGNFSILGKFT